MTAAPTLEPLAAVQGVLPVHCAASAASAAVAAAPVRWAHLLARPSPAAVLLPSPPPNGALVTHFATKLLASAHISHRRPPKRSAPHTRRRSAPHPTLGAPHLPRWRRRHGGRACCSLSAATKPLLLISRPCTSSVTAPRIVQPASPQSAQPRPPQDAGPRTPTG